MLGQSKPISFPYDHKKATQAILWLLNKNGGAMDKLQFIKLFFYADREHLVRYGRLIAGGTYYIMKNGPVCSEVLDILDSVQSGSQDWPLSASGHDILASAPPTTKCLSQSDLDIIDEIYENYGHIDKWKLRDMTHLLPSCKKNELQEGEKRHLFPYEDFFEDYDKESRGMLKVILDDQRAWADFA